jgi:hypothetical protein
MQVRYLAILDRQLRVYCRDSSGTSSPVFKSNMIDRPVYQAGVHTLRFAELRRDPCSHALHTAIELHYISPQRRKAIGSVKDMFVLHLSLNPICGIRFTLDAS